MRLARRVPTRTWKGSTALVLAAFLMVAAVTGCADEAHDSGQVGNEAEFQAGSNSRESRDSAAALRRERQQLRKERARLRRERAAARRERVRIRRQRAEARREHERREQAEVEQAPVAPEPVANCHPSYDPCLDPNASDYDCEGGSGDGPMYTGFVTVKGSDDYGLDSDGDGTGCE
jgi:hypothetical protein